MIFWSINTTIGTVHGSMDDTTPKVTYFLGISFAKPPVASLRFAAPTAERLVASISATELVLRVARVEVQARLYTPLIRQIC